MIALPEIPTQRIAVKLNPKAEILVKKGHPWIFDKSITKQNKPAKAGDLAIIFNQKDNKFLAVGLLDPSSPIRIKILQANKSANINTDWFKNKIQEAYNKRIPLLKPNTNSYRLIYGENDNLPSFIVDVYNKVLVIKLYSNIWLPYLKEIIPHLIEVSKTETVVLRLSRNTLKEGNKHGLEDGQIIHGNLDNPVVVFKEHGVNFSANVIKGHKTGYFLDHRHNRKTVGKLAKNKTVLDVFSYAGGFSVHALAGEATEVTSLDISAQALEIAKQNAKLNKFKGKHHIIVGDAFDKLEKLIDENKKFDVVVIDPPSFAKSKAEIDGAIKSYASLTKLGLKLVAKKGILVMASCSSRVEADTFYELVLATAYNSNRKFDVINKTQHDIDHPISFKEGAYLKTIYLQMH